MKNMKKIILTFLCLILLHKSSFADFTNEVAWTDPTTGTNFYKNDVPNSNHYYYIPPLKLVPYIAGAHDYFNRIEHQGWWSHYYEYTFRLIVNYGDELLERAQESLGKESTFQEVNINYFAHKNSTLPNKPYEKMIVTPHEGDGPLLEREFEIAFKVQVDQKQRFEGFLTSQRGISINFNAGITGAKIAYFGSIEFNSRDLSQVLRERVTALGRAATEEDVQTILRELENIGLWKIFQRPDPDYPEKVEQAKNIFLQALDVLQSYYFNINQNGELVQKRESDLGQSISLILADSVRVEYNDLPIHFSLKLPENVSAETKEEVQIREADKKLDTPQGGE